MLLLNWFVTFVDGCTRMTWDYLKKNNGEVGSIFQNFYQMIRTQFSLPIKVIRLDNGGEYIYSELSQFFFNENDIVLETACPRTPKQNGVAEQKNRHILETSRALLIGASIGFSVLLGRCGYICSVPCESNALPCS